MGEVKGQRHILSNWILLSHVFWLVKYRFNTITSSDGNIFGAPGLFLGESTGHRWIPLRKGQ